jgi:hypothetical protein
MKQVFHKSSVYTNSMVAGILSSFLFLGVGGRFAMRVIAILAEQEPVFTFEGTIAVLVFSTAIGIVGGASFPFVGKFLPGSTTAKGGAWGLLLFVVLIPMLPADIQQEALNFEHLLPLSITLFGLLFLAFGVVLELVARILCPSIHVQKHCVLDFCNSQPTYEPFTNHKRRYIENKPSRSRCQFHAQRIDADKFSLRTKAE